MKSRHIFITGASRGIGKAVACKFAKNKDHVTLASQSETKMQPVLQEISSLGGTAFAVSGNIASRSDVVTMFEKARLNVGPVDVLVNSAGIYPSNPIPSVTDEEWDLIMDINLRGTFLCSQIAVMDMLKKQRGWIVNIASIDGISPGPNNAVYSASKAGVVSITRSFAAEFAERGLNVNAVAPGWVGTPNIYKSNRWEEAIKKIPLGRLAKPSEIADTIYFLCSEEARYISGEVININGGMFMN